MLEELWGNADSLVPLQNEWNQESLGVRRCCVSGFSHTITSLASDSSSTKMGPLWPLSWELDWYSNSAGSSHRSPSINYSPEKSLRASSRCLQKHSQFLSIHSRKTQEWNILICWLQSLLDSGISGNSAGFFSFILFPFFFLKTMPCNMYNKKTVSLCFFFNKLREKSGRW